MFFLFPALAWRTNLGSDWFLFDFCPRSALPLSTYQKSVLNCWQQVAVFIVPDFNNNYGNNNNDNVSTVWYSLCLDSYHRTASIMGFVTSVCFIYKMNPSRSPSPLCAEIYIYKYIYMTVFRNHTVCIYIYIQNTEVKLLCIFASFYLSNCDVIGFRPKVCYCNTFTEKKKKNQKMLLKCCCSQRFYACTYAVVKLQRNE